MSTKAVTTSAPVDTPIEVKPGIVQREADFHGSSYSFGDVGKSEGASVEGLRKGNRPLEREPVRESLNPFAKLRGGS